MKNLILYKNPDDNWKSEKINSRMVDIPKDFINNNIQKVSTLMSSKRVFVHDYTKSGIPFFRGQEVTEKSKNIFKKASIFISNEKFNFFKNKYGVPKVGDILITAVGTVGNSMLVNEGDGNFYYKDGNIIQLSKIKSEYLKSEYLYTLLNFKKIKSDIKFISEGNAHKALTIKEFNKFFIYYPKDIKEQENIAKILTNQENIISKLKSLKVKKQKMIKYFQQEELSGRLRLRLTQNSARYLLNKGILVSDGVTEVDVFYPINDNSVISIAEGKEKEFEDYLSVDFDSKIEFYLNGDDNWKEVKINGRMVDIPRDWVDKLVESIIKANPKSKIVAKDDNTTGEFKLFNCSKKQTKWSNNSISDKKSILLSTGGIPAIHYINEPHSYTTDVFSFSNKNTKRFLLEYFYQFFLLHEKIIESCFQGSGLKHLSKKLFNKTKWFLPQTILEQTLIATHLTNLDKEIEVLDTKIEKEEKVFTYLSQELLSGRLRVKPNEEQ